MKRFLDLFFSIIGLIICLPLLLFLACLIKLDSKGSVFYKQVRVGKGNRDFKILKFRTMKENSDRRGLLTIGSSDVRITNIGRFMRKYKIDELPQLINVIQGNMSIVGPRPEVRKYVDLYTNEQKRVLTVRPGLTDFASIRYLNENELLAQSNDPEKQYIENIMPDKLKLNLDYIDQQSCWLDMKIIWQTLISIVK